jgi:hypothetical protein
MLILRIWPFSVDVCSVPQLKVYLSWKSRSSVGVPQLEVSVLLCGNISDRRGITVVVLLNIQVRGPE